MKQRILSLILLCSLLIACGTNKQGQLKPLSKMYQNTTARYNGYFNGKELYKKSLKTLEETYTDNYNRVLPMYRHVAIDQTSSVANDLDVTMEKATTVVNLHPRSKWVDDCYFLVGQSQFVKKEYDAAEHTFGYVVNEFHPDNLEIASMRKAAKYERKAMERDDEVAKKNKRSRRKTNASSNKPKTEKTKKRSKRKTSDDVKKDSDDKDKKKSREERLKERKKKKKESTKRKKNKTRDKDAGQLTGASRAEKKEKREQYRREEEEEKEEETLERISASKDKGESYFLKHKPVHSDAMLWLAKTYVLNKKYDDALFKLSQLEDDASTRQDVLEQIHEVRAFAYLEKGEYASAIEPLNLALEHSDRGQRARYNYILGQVYEENNQKQKASEAYGRVVGLHPDYEMEFHARLNQIRSQWDGSDDNKERTVNLLKKMLKDEKNEEFKDQIYFTLGESYIEQGEIALAHESFREAVKYARGNKHILTESYYILAEYQFAERDYVTAKYLYDTTLTNMLRTDDRYPATLDRSKRLIAVTTQLDIIALQDSLVILSALTDDEKRLFAYKVKSERNKNKKDKENSDSRSADNVKNAFAGGPVTKSRDKSNFFAYNDKSLSKGKQEFTKRWGTRVLEDNWRRSEKSIESSLTDIELDVIESEELTQKEIDKMFGDVPKTEEEVIQAKAKSRSAMLSLAKQYNHQLDDKPLSIATLKEFLMKYGDSEDEEEALYTLYLVYIESNDLGLADQTKDRLESKYGEGEYVQIINNPLYVSEKKTALSSILNDYDQAYTLFESGEASGALDGLNAIEGRSTIPALVAPKFALLTAMCIGKVDGKEAYIKALESVVGDHPNTDEEARAKEILRYLRGDTNVFNEQDEASDSPFVTQNNRLHYVLVIFDQVNEDIKINKLRSDVSDYNREYHKLKKLRVGNVFLSRDDTKPILIIRKFTNADLALDYYHSVNKNIDNFLGVHEKHLIIINQKNYREVLRTKKLEDYETFFKKNYL